jgi:hypothetical protein
MDRTGSADEGADMGTIRKTRRIAVDPDRAWAALRDWSGLREKLVSDFVKDVRMDGADRIVTFDNDLVVRERLVSAEPDARRLVWTVVGGTFAHYNGAAAVVGNADGSTSFVWTSDVLPDDHLPALDEMMERGIGSIKRTLEGAP